MLPFPSIIKTLMLSATLSAALLLMACLEGEIGASITPLGANETFSVNDTAVIYSIGNDTVEKYVTYHLCEDTVYKTEMRFIFNDEQMAQQFIASCPDEGIEEIIQDQQTIICSTDNCNGLHSLDIVEILKGEYQYDEVNTLDQDHTPHEFSVTIFNGLQDGMYVIPSYRVNDDSRVFYSNNSLAGHVHNSVSITDSTISPWRLRKAEAEGFWYIELSNGRFLRRSGNRLIPFALTTCSTREQATPWIIKDVVTPLNFWTIHTDIKHTTDFYGITCNPNNELTISLNSLDSFSFFVSQINLTFHAEGKVWNTYTSLRGGAFTLPNYTGTHEGATFIGWNTIENQVEGYLPPGTVIESNETDYYAVFVRSE